MRYINPTTLYEKYKDRHDAKLWTDPTLKKDFGEFFHWKCWYTECPFDGQDVHIDHFRPKAKVVPYKNYNYNKTIAAKGYYWLANECTNYRACCIVANRRTGDGGKSNYFPLKEKSAYAKKDSLNGEVAMLLDPIVKSDVELLSFFRNQVDCSATDSYDISRVDVTKAIYNLENPLIKSRRLSKWEEVERSIYSYLQGSSDHLRLLQDLLILCDRKSPYSAVAINCIKHNIGIIPPEVYNQLDLTL